MISADLQSESSILLQLGIEYCSSGNLSPSFIKFSLLRQIALCKKVRLKILSTSCRASGKITSKSRSEIASVTANAGRFSSG